MCVCVFRFTPNGLVLVGKVINAVGGSVDDLFILAYGVVVVGVGVANPIEKSFGSFVVKLLGHPLVEIRGLAFVKLAALALAI